ncbi:MAG: hypothetical protein FJ338_04720 [Sphingomonadales bacterium]|nr:hypothetical protein [Sphingomonadales bacterium]MBM3932319.1 hypothetical protein [Sphingomonadales bacterium]
MARKVHKLSLEADLAVLGLDSTLAPYALAGGLNKGFGWNLVRSRRDAELAFSSKGKLTASNPVENGEEFDKGDSDISYFQLFFQELEFYTAPLCLVANRGSLGLLLPAMRNFNYLLTWPKEAEEYSDVLLHRKIGNLEGVNFAADITSRLGAQAMTSLQFAPSLQEPKEKRNHEHEIPGGVGQGN